MLSATVCRQKRSKMFYSFRQTLAFSKTTWVRDHSKARTTFRKRINTNQGGDMRKTILALLVIGLPLFVGILATHADEGGVVRFATLPPGPGHPEGIAADAKGNIYVATFDSFGGNVFKIDLPVGSVSTFVNDELLKPGSHGFPGFGANGLAFSSDGATLFVANTADDRILKINVASKPVTVTVFAESVNEAD